MECFKHLYKLVVEGVEPDSSVIQSVLELARVNRVYLHSLKALGLTDCGEEAGLRRITDLLSEVVYVLRGIEYVVHKLVKPVIYVPPDVDVLVHYRDFPKALKRLLQRGFRPVAVDPYSTTLARGSDIVDLYAHPSTGYFVFLDGVKLLEYATASEFNGVEAPMLPGDVEALITIAHAVYKEWLINLNDYVTVREWLTARSLKLAGEMKVTAAVNYFTSVMRRVESGEIALPYKIPMVVTATLYACKVLQDPMPRSLILRHALSISNKRYVHLLRDKLVRRSY